MEKILCGARACAHNMSGRCDAGVVRAEELIGAGGFAYCGTFTRWSDPSNTLREPSDGGSLICAMLLCAHNNHGFCEAEHVEFSQPVPAESSLTLCADYTKKQT